MVNGMRPRLGRVARRRLTELALDALFISWMVYVLATGSLIPGELARLLFPEHPVVVTREPPDVPFETDFVDILPET